MRTKTKATFILTLGLAAMLALSGCASDSAESTAAGSTAESTAIPSEESTVESTAASSEDSMAESTSESSLAAESTAAADTAAESTASAAKDTAAAGTATTGTAAADTSHGVLGSFSTTTIDGTPATDAVFANADLTMINIWATYCGPCIQEMPELAELNKDYASRGFQVIGIISDVQEASDADALSVISQTGANYTHLVLSESLYDNYVSSLQYVPTTLFVDKNGKQLGETEVGSHEKAEWATMIEQHLQEVGR